ncbi:MAG: hypothetical protein JXA25_11080 [Anaerolineales bacterium]|nr:hypothetical protein [Anaerolineales bacterium]
MNDPITIKALNGAVYQMVRASKPGQHPVLLLHGWTGNETNMWNLASMLDTGGLMVSVRGFFPAGEGYSWIEHAEKNFSRMDSYNGAVETLEMVIRDVIVRTGMDRHDLVMLGFSQGAAMAFAAGRSFSYKPQGIIAASGFLPEGNLDGLEKIQVFWGHGIKDEIVALETAQVGVDRLRAAGIPVQFCQADIGHKISHQCLRGVQDWIKQLPVEEHFLHS